MGGMEMPLCAGGDCGPSLLTLGRPGLIAEGVLRRAKPALYDLQELPAVHVVGRTVLRISPVLLACRADVPWQGSSGRIPAGGQWVRIDLAGVESPCGRGGTVAGVVAFAA